jgi:WD40 repeat protein
VFSLPSVFLEKSANVYRKGWQGKIVSRFEHVFFYNDLACLGPTRCPTDRRLLRRRILMFRTRSLYCILCAALAGALALAAFGFLPRTSNAQPAAKPPAPKGPVSFINDVAPILKESCFGCHGAKNPKGKLDMTRYETFRRGGTKDDPIVPGKPEDSYLIDVLTAMGKKQMPPEDSGDPLPKDQIDVISRWIKEGAKLDAGLKKESDLLKELRLRWKPPVPNAVYTFPVTVTGLIFSPDGKQLIASGNHELTVWEASTGKLLKRVRTRARRNMAMVFLPDGKLAVAGGRPGEEGDVRVYNLTGGTPKVVDGVTHLDGVNDAGVMVKQLLDADDEVLCLALRADGKKLAAGGCDRMVQVWDISGGAAAAKSEAVIENHADWVFGVAFSPDGKTLYTSSRDKTAKVWDLAGKESVLTFPEHQNGVYGVAAKADGKVGYSVGEDNNLRSWNASGPNAGKQIRATGAGGKGIQKLVFIPKGNLLATCSGDGQVRLWNADSFAAVRSFPGHKDYVYALAVSPDGSLIAAAGFAGEIRVWKVADGALVKAFNASPGYKEPATKPIKK